MIWLRETLVSALQRHLASPNEEPDIPPAGLRIWKIFCDLNATRAIGFGPCPISYLEIEAYASMMRTPIRPFEIEIVRALDRALLEHAGNRVKQGDAESVSTRPMSPALFDALFRGGR
ncbi:MAG: phage tail assembly chaperone [Pseudomonadota bacterium]